MSNRQKEGMTTEDVHKKYQLYSVEEFLQDNFFIRSILHPTKETEHFWYSMIDDGIINANDFKLACNFINLVQVDSMEIGSKEIRRLWANIENSIHKSEQKKKRSIRLLFSVVASITILLTSGLGLYHYGYFSNDEATSVNIENVKAPETMAENILLILTDDETVSVEGQEAKIAYNKGGIAINNKETGWKNEQSKSEKTTTFNQLIVPLGKRSMLTFAEGSRMWVNAGTRVVYPVAFHADKREIYIDGEVFLEVSPDENRPFIVKTKKLKVEVLGTSFNVMAYANDTSQNVVLVSGIVKVHSNLENQKQIILLPNEMYSCTSNSTTVKPVNINDYVSWMSGVYQYESKSLESIMERLSRYYGKTIVCSPQVAHLTCSGKLDLKDDIELVLKGISKTAPVVWKNENGLYIITNQ